MLLAMLVGMAALVVGLGLLLSATADNDRTPDDYGMCTPSRYEPLTRNPADHIAPMQPYRAPQTARVLAVPWQVDDIDNLEGWGDDIDDLEPEAVPAYVVVPDWPRRVEVEPEPVPVVVDWTAARFAALELRGGNRGT